MATNLGWFWDIRGHYPEAQRRLNAALAAAPDDSPARDLALFWAGRLACHLAEPETSRALLEEALRHAQGGDERLAILTMTHLGQAISMLGDDTASLATHRAAIARARAAGDEWALGLALNSYAVFSPVLADLDQTRALLEESLAIRRRTREPRGIASAAANLALAVLATGQIEYAETLNNEALARAREIDFRPIIGAALGTRVDIALMRGELDDALAHLRESLMTGGHTHLHAGGLLSVAGTIAAQQHDPVRAATLWAAADRVKAQSGLAEAPPGAKLRARWEPEARAALADADAWTAAWRVGTELPLDDALALAASAADMTRPHRANVDPTVENDAEPSASLDRQRVTRAGGSQG